MKLNFNDYESIPSHTKEALNNYVEHGYQPGSFVYAVLTNNLVEAVSRADNQNRAALSEIATFLYNRMPSNMWGNQEKVTRYLNTFSQ